VTAPSRAAVVVPAGGVGTRMGARGPRKQYLELAGEPILLRSLRVFLDHPAFRWIVVALPADDMASPPLFLPQGVTVVAGGETRSESVRCGLDAVPDDAEVVLIHDAARPLVDRTTVDRVLAASATGVGAVAAVPVSDTLKRVDEDRGVVATVDRSGLWQAQTPQGFPRRMVMEAYRRAAREGVAATDDAGLVERYGGRVVVVDGDVRNVKVTRPEDLALAETLLATEQAR
jgi:2-C-methyl-D-erythritol 4-phosphate cytidylyltransferase